MHSSYHIACCGIIGCVIGMEAIGFTISTIGKVLIGVSAFNVHRRIAHEHRIDKKVLRGMQREKVLAILGIVLMIIGYVLELPYRQ